MNMIKKFIYAAIISCLICSCDTTESKNYDHFDLDEDNWVESIERVINNILDRLIALEDNDYTQDKHIDVLAGEIEELYDRVDELEYFLGKQDSTIKANGGEITENKESIKKVNQEILTIRTLAETLQSQLEDLKKQQSGQNSGTKGE